MIAIVVLCGIPGVGKSTFSVKLRNVLNSSFESNLCAIVEFDNLFETNQNEEKSNSIIFDPNLWQNTRMQSLLSTESEIQRCINDNEDRIIIIDDNMYYRSMRRSFFQIARKYEAGYIQIYLNSSLSNILSNNKNRPQHRIVSEEIILNMLQKFEVPNKDLYWEKNSFTINLDSSIDQKESIPWNDIIECIKKPTQKIKEIDYLEKEKSNLSNLHSIHHQFDLISRKIISNEILNCKDITNKKTFAKLINEKRKFFMESIDSLLIDMNIQQDEDENYALEILRKKFELEIVEMK